MTSFDAAVYRLASPAAWGRFVVRVVLVAIVVAGAALLLGASLAPTARVAADVVTRIDHRLLDIPPLPRKFAEPAVRSRILARDGSLLAILHGAENRKIVPLKKVPKHVREAVIATEDAEFRRHEGVNWRAIVRAAVGNVQAGRITSGASTITQQYVKNVVVGDAVTLDRKLREAVYAIQLEQRLTKNEILEAYLNRSYFSNGVYGISTAAEYYFGKRVEKLGVAQGALLAGIIRSPLSNDPIDHRRAARQRRNIVLDQMAAAGFLDPREAKWLKTRPLGLRITPVQQPRQPSFVDYVKKRLLDNPALGETREDRRDMLFGGGLSVRTTLDRRLQPIAQESIREVLGTRPSAPLGALTAVDPRTGQILAVGFGPRPYGEDKGETKINPALPGVGSSQGRQSGSAFKVFELVAALEKGVPPAYTIDTPSPYTATRPECSSGGAPYSVGNYSDGGTGILDMGQATAVSSNVFFTHLMDRFTGPGKLVDAARRMGITHTKLVGYCSSVLGTEGVFPLDMASAFGTLANHGAHCRPYAIQRVTDRHGRVLMRGGGTCPRVVERDVAARAVDLLRGPIEHGTASARGQLGRPAAGKTGTTQDYKDAWFVGFIPQLSTASWIGYERPRPMYDYRCGPVTGGCLPTMMWQRFMSRAIARLDLPVRGFATPPALPTGYVPSVVGMSESTARATITRAKFSPFVDVVRHHLPAGVVVSQSPGAGARTELGRPVFLRVSNGEGKPPAPKPDKSDRDRPGPPPGRGADAPAPGPTPKPTERPGTGDGDSGDDAGDGGGGDGTG